MKQKTIIVIMLVLFAFSFMSSAQNVRLPQAPNTPQHIDYSVKETGYWFAVLPSVAISSVSGEKVSSCVQLEFSNGYRFSEYFKAGIGIAPRFYFYGYAKESAFKLPLFADVHGNFISQYHSMWAPCWNANVGYSFGEGTFGSAGVGVRFGGIRHNFVMSLYYSIQGRNESEKKALNMFGLKLGYEF